MSTSPQDKDDVVPHLPVVHRMFGQKNCSWWDSNDGIHGGYQIRVTLTPEQTSAILQFQLFPPGPDRLGIVTLRGKQFEMVYAAVAPTNADEYGPVGMLFSAQEQEGIRFPADAAFVIPNVERCAKLKTAKVVQQEEKVKNNSSWPALH